MTAAAAQCSPVPNVALPRVGGGEINPSSLIGQELVLIFCPSDPLAAGREIEDYRSRAEEFAHHGVWLLGLLDAATEPPRRGAGEAEVALARDTAGTAWEAIRPWLPDSNAPRSEGGVILFGRWGCFIRAWTGIGHAGEVLEEARRRS